MTQVAVPAPALERRDFQIIPLKGLPIVAVAFAALIVAIAANKLWPLEFLHVVFGAAWTGTATSVIPHDLSAAGLSHASTETWRFVRGGSRDAYWADG